MSDYTHEDAMRDLDIVTFPYLIADSSIKELDARKSRLAAYITDLEAAAAHHQAQLAEVRAKDEAIAKDALCEMYVHAPGFPCPVPIPSCERPCAECLAAFYYDRAVERA